MGLSGFPGMRNSILTENLFFRRSVACDQALEAVLGAARALFLLEQTRIMMQCEDQTIHFINDLPGIGIGAQMSRIYRLRHATLQRGLPDFHHADQFLAYRARAVVVFNGAADINAAGSDFHRYAPNP